MSQISRGEFDRLPWSGMAMARIGLRMMPPFPSPSLRFRPVSFPQSGSKAGISDVAFLDTASRGWVQFAYALRAPAANNVVSSFRVEERGTPMHHRSSGPAALPQGSSLQSELCCLGPSSLMRPHAPHSLSTPRFHRCGLYEMPSLCGQNLRRLGDQRVVPCFHR
jgi:hypothetical protein